VTFDETLGAILGLVGERVEVHGFDAGESPHLVATFGGRLRTGYSMTGGEPSDTEAIFVRLDPDTETAAMSLVARCSTGLSSTRTGRSPYDSAVSSLLLRAATKRLTPSDAA
jgi:hypothetical protein